MNQETNLRSIVAGAPDLESLERASGGQVHRIGSIDQDDAVFLKVEGKYYVYSRVNARGQGRGSAFNTRKLRDYLDPDKSRARAGQQLDHVASSNVEGARIGNRYSLMAYINGKVNQSHGRTYERGVNGLREFNAAAGKGAPDERYGCTMLTKQMVDKLANKPPEGNTRNAEIGPRSTEEAKTINTSLMLDDASQSRADQVAKPREEAALAKARIAKDQHVGPEARALKSRFTSSGGKHEATSKSTVAQTPSSAAAKLPPRSALSSSPAPTPHQWAGPSTGRSR